MSEILDTFKNPWVLGGGAAVGLVLLMMAKTNTNAGTASDVSNAGGMPASIVGQYNIAALDAVTKQAQIAASLGAVAIQADAQKQVSVLNVIQNNSNNLAQVQQAALTTGASIINNQITSQSAVIIDAMNNSNRLGLAQEQTIQTKITTNGAVQIAQEQAKAARNASNNALIGSLLGSVASVVAAPFTGGASLLGLAGAFGGSSGPSTGSLIASGFTNTGPQLGDPVY